VAVCARRSAQARALARAVGGKAVPRAALRDEFFDVIINCTPVGMYPRSGDSPLSPRELHCRIVMDLIYRPQETRLLALARRRGLAAVSGVEMFLAQGMAQWEIWTERRAPEAAMRRAVLRALRVEALAPSKDLGAR
jgi:shikimate 5-dehydrogenase